MSFYFFHSLFYQLLAAFDNFGNFCVADIWESEEHLNNFINNRVLPAMKKINMPMPEGEIFQINDVNAFPCIKYD